MVVDREQRELGFERGGRVQAVFVRVGDVVREGQVIARLAGDALALSVAQGEAAALKAARDSARASELGRTGAVAAHIVDDAATALELAQASLRLAREHRSYSVMVAPHGGTVVRRLAEPGEVVAPGTPVLVLSGSAVGRVARFGVVDRDVVRIALGDRATVTLDALEGVVFEGTVTEIAELPSPGTGTFAVEIALSEGSPTLRVGLVARATIEPSSLSEVALVPAEALFEAETHRGVVFVASADGRSVRRRAVSIAYVAGAEVVISEGLEGEERVVVTGLSALADGARVSVTAGASPGR